MKILKRILLVFLAVVMSTSLIACKSEEITEYVFDYQILEGKLIFDVDGEDITDVLYHDSNTVEYEPVYTIADGRLEIKIEENMVDASIDKYISFNIGEKSFDYKFSVNIITDNYYNVDESDSYVLATSSKAGNVKLNGQKIKNGITVSKTAITLEKSLFVNNMGHNTLEYEVGGVKYFVSVCAITNAQLNAPITFEDGVMSPFVTVFGGNYRVVKASEADEVVQTKYANYKYQTINSEYTVTSEVENKYLLEIENKLGATESVKMYTSSYWLKNRIEHMKKYPYEERMLKRVSDFFEQEKGMDTEFNQQLFFVVRRFSNSWYYSECSMLAGDTQDYVLNSNKIPGGSQFNRRLSEGRAFCNKELYDATFNADGTLKYNFISMVFSSPNEKTGTYNIYIDDICSALSPYSVEIKNVVTGYTL